MLSKSKFRCHPNSTSCHTRHFLIQMINYSTWTLIIDAICIEYQSMQKLLMGMLIESISEHLLCDWRKDVVLRNNIWAAHHLLYTAHTCLNVSYAACLIEVNRKGVPPRGWVNWQGWGSSPCNDYNKVWNQDLYWHLSSEPVSVVNPEIKDR